MSDATLDNETVAGLRDWLTQCGRSRGNPDARYSGSDALLLDLGRPMPGRPLPADIPAGEPQQCYRNAIELVWAQMGERTLTYYEGLGIRPSLGIPIAHAWCVDEDGSVIDSTWQNPQECTYWGVGFDLRFLLRHANETGYYGVFDSHWMVKGCPLYDLGAVLDDEDNICNYNEG